MTSDETSNTRRHPAALTALRIGDHLTTYREHLTPTENAVLIAAQSALEQVAERTRSEAKS